MELVFLIGIAVALVVVLITLKFFKKKTNEDQKAGKNFLFYFLSFLRFLFQISQFLITAPREQRRGVAAPVQEGVPRRAAIARNQRNRARAVVEEQVDEEEADEDDTGAGIEFSDKMGAKKRAKLEAKAERAKQREVEQKMREDQKKRDELIEAERQLQQKKEEEEEKQREEAERKAREEKERQEYEEYLKLKQAFSVEEEGFEEEDESSNLLQDFIQYIKDNKVVVIEDVAGHFKMKTQAAIDRIKDLQTEGTISGVIDDRGKFIYISEEELNAVAKFIKQRGRVSISELAESSNKLINLTPVASS